MTSLDDLARIGAQNHFLAVVATTRADGSVHASLVNAGVLGDEVAFVAAGAARKLDHIRRSGRASLTFTAGWQWVGVEGPARIAGGDPALLRDVFRAAGGTHEDWDEFDRVMAAEQRVAVLLRPDRVLGNG